MTQQNLTSEPAGTASKPARIGVSELAGESELKPATINSRIRLVDQKLYLRDVSSGGLLDLHDSALLRFPVFSHSYRTFKKKLLEELLRFAGDKIEVHMFVDDKLEGVKVLSGVVITSLPQDGSVEIGYREEEYRPS